MLGGRVPLSVSHLHDLDAVTATGVERVATADAALHPAVVSIINVSTTGGTSTTRFWLRSRGCKNARGCTRGAPLPDCWGAGEAGEAKPG